MKLNLIIAAVGLVLALIGILIICALNKKLKRCSAPLSAGIVTVNSKFHQKNDPADSYTTYSPVVQYTVNEKLFRGNTPLISKDEQQYLPGGTVDIRYNPKRPSEFIIPGKTARKRLRSGIPLTVIGVGLIVLALVLIFKK